MSKPATKKGPDSGLILACVAYGMLLGYFLGEEAAKKKARAEAEKLDLRRQLSDLQLHVHRLENPELYKEANTRQEAA